MRHLRRPVFGLIRHVLRGGALVLALVAAAGAQRAKEYEVKAAMLLSITRYVTWPSTALKGADDVFVVGVVGDDPFGEVLDRTFRGQNFEGHRFVVRRYAWGQRFDDAHLLFLARTESKSVSKFVAAVEKRPILTVGDTESFAASGGMIGLRTRSGRIEMEVNLRSARASDIAVSSKLLMLAKSVIDGRGGR